MTTAQQLARCSAEIREIQQRPDVVAGTVPAWLVCLGVSDWEDEARLIRKHAGQNLFCGEGEKTVKLESANSAEPDGVSAPELAPNPHTEVTGMKAATSLSYPISPSESRRVLRAETR